MPRMRFNAPMALACSVSRYAASRAPPQARQGLTLPQAQHAVDMANTFFGVDADACCANDIKAHYAYQNLSGT